MSKPKNLLADFRTYSYHHILAVCKNTSVAESLVNSNRFDSSGSGYKILVDGRKNARFVANKVKLSTVIAPNIPGEHYSGTIMTEGEVVIQEPRGVRFLNELEKAYTEFGIDSTSAVYVLKTMFVGYTKDNQREEINNVPAAMFILYDLTANFDITGATYNIRFAPLVNGAAFMPSYSSSIQNIAALRLEKDATIKKAIDTLQSTLKFAYSEFKECITNELGDIEFKEVEYLFDLKDPYTSDEYKIDATKDQTTDTAENNPIIRFGKNATIESAIETIMNASKKVLDEGNAKDRYSFKINSVVEPKDDKVTITYVINRYKVPISVFDALSTGQSITAEPGNVLELDYIFSGKNVDILDFDIKMALGIVFISTLTPTNSVADTPKDHNSDNKPSATQATVSPNSKNRKVVLPFSNVDKTTLAKHSKYPTSSANFQQMLSRFAGIEGLDASITIAGNPAMMANLQRPPSKAKNNEAVEFGENGGIMKNYDTTPALCKVNIFMPATDSVTEFDQEPFWYQGYYYMFGVDSLFEDGGFTQTIEMISLPVDFQIPNKEKEKEKTKPGNGAKDQKTPHDGSSSGTKKEDLKSGDVVSDANADPQQSGC